MIFTLAISLLMGPPTFQFSGGTVFDLARKLDDGTGVVVSVNSNHQVKPFEFKYDDQKDFDRLLLAKSGIRRMGTGAYAARGYPLHMMDPPAWRTQKGGPMRQVFLWDSPWPMEDSGGKWRLTNQKDEPLRLGLFPSGLAGKTLSMPQFFERLEVFVTPGIYEPKALATKIAAALGGKLKATGGAFEIVPNLSEVRARVIETFDEKLSTMKPTDTRTQYEFATAEFAREMFRIAPDKAITTVLKNENSEDFTVPREARPWTTVERRAVAYSRLPNYPTISPTLPLQPSNFLQTADWDRPVEASVRSWPLSASLAVSIKGKNSGMGF